MKLLSKEAIARIRETEIEAGKIRAGAEEVIEESREEARNGTADMEAAARTHMRDAVKLIVWEIYDSCQ